MRTRQPSLCKTDRDSIDCAEIKIKPGLYILLKREALIETQIDLGMSLESAELITKASNVVLAAPLANGPYNPVMERNSIEELKQFYRQRSRILSLFRTSKAGATDASWVADVQMLGDPMPGSSLADKFMYVNFPFCPPTDTVCPAI